MKLAELARELNISTDSFIRFIHDFDLELSECVATDFEVKDDFARFARENINFLHNYQIDLGQSKSVEEIAGTINQPEEKVADIISRYKPPIFENGIFRASVSSYDIDNKLGGNYKFVYDYFGKKMPLAARNFIGYRDLFFHISQTLDPFLNDTPLTDWGIHKPAGIILYGPPGCGKIFWARKIAKIIGYKFKEIRKYYLGTSFVNGKKTLFRDFLAETMDEKKTLLFMDDFEVLMSERSDSKSVTSFDEETKEVILQYISRFEDANLLMVGSAISPAEISSEILAPGRFDVLIPIFPPNAQERSEIILYSMTQNLSEDATLMKILIENDAQHQPFWADISQKMKVFSNTMLIDFTQSLKKRIRSHYLKNNSEKINIKSFLKPALREASAKLTDAYLSQVAQFVTDVSQNHYDDFPQRIEALKAELLKYRIADPPRKKIGFTQNKD